MQDGAGTSQLVNLFNSLSNDKVFPKEYDICPQCNTNGTYYAY